MHAVASTASQLPLFGRTTSSFDGSFASVVRTELQHGAWIELARAWVGGESELFDELNGGVAWRAEDRRMYDRTVDVPRLCAEVPSEGRHPLVERMRAALGERYGTSFVRVSAALYRDGSDSVAWHGDTIARELPDALVATVSLGAPRRFLIRPTGGGASTALNLGWGDLVVMGGTCQRTYQHSIPKVSHAGARIAVMFRPSWHADPGRGATRR